MKVIDLETIEPKEVKQKIQNITDTVSRELRVYRARVRVEEGVTENRYVLSENKGNKLVVDDIEVVVRGV